MTRSASRKPAQLPTDNPTRSSASWVFGSLLLAFSLWVFTFAPDTLPEYKHRMLGIFLALLSGLFAFFLTGDMGLKIKSPESRFGKVVVKATGGIAVFALVLWWWSSPLAPVQVEKKLDEIKAKLEDELSFKNAQIEFLQGQVERLQTISPSRRATELAAQIPTDADPYALALKAMAESRFDDARRLLGEAERNKEVELARIYLVHGRTEIYAARYADAVGWYKKALALRPDDPYISNETAFALMHAGQYAEAESLFKQSLTIREQFLATREKFLGSKHPDVTPIPDGLAVLYHIQGRYAEAEPLYKQSLAILGKVLGPNHPYEATISNDLANLYYVQGKYAEAEPLYQRVLVIREKALGPEHPDVAQSLNYLAVLYYAQGKYTEAEPLCQRALAIREKALGPEHPDVAQSLNNLAVLYRAQGRYIEAVPLLQRALAIRLSGRLSLSDLTRAPTSFQKRL